MSALYETVKRLDEFLKDAGKSDKERIQIKGQISIKAGIMLVGINEHTADDPGKLSSLKAAIRAVLGVEL
jgi:hypothetical protein